VAHSTLSTRPSGALALLRDTGGRPPPPPARWSWAVVALDPEGRVGLPWAARRALGAAAGTAMTARAVARGAVLVLRADPDGAGAGAVLALDGRGRVRLPLWWRRACASGACAVATRAGTAAVAEASLVVLAPTGVLDGLADVLVGERR
jgi:hypothetical protein